ncbi:energy-coupling factor ABC transporter permease [Sedimenticola hydrogenitrophicus]|uniref:energy-coupling factor ABC transporter permease n=1 Tax=Sedimenticola hydrogenitrophicus TaxID=2967975 RepID=UPI0021A5B9FD|nr:energy-coupling factor ABC transporter permease [Sedimenticola hydrogenitrophicus]
MLGVGLNSGWGWWLCLLLYGIGLLLAMWAAPWRKLLSQRLLQHLFLGATVLLIGLWQMRAGISPGLSIHILGATLVALMFGWALAVVAMSLALLAMVLVGHLGWDDFPVRGLLMILIPVLVSYGHHLLIRRLLPKNFFVYLLGTVFLGAGLSVAAMVLATVLLYSLADVYSLQKLTHEYLVFLPLIMLSEAMVNGMLMTGLMANYPNLIRTFGAKNYIDGH